MSNALAIAAVTAVLKDLLDNGLIDRNISAAVGGPVTVSATPPDRIQTGTTEPTQLNLFLYHLAPNVGWRNAALPSHTPRGDRQSNPPLALDLFYLLTAYGQNDFEAEILLGYAMQMLHETPVLARDAIRRSLSPTSPVSGGELLPPPLNALAAAELANQIELIKLTIQPMNGEETSRLWSALQANYRPSVAYQASVVLIESHRPARSPLPVLTRGPADQGVTVQADPTPPPPSFPTLTTLLLPNQQTGARLDDTLVISGHHLAGDAVVVHFRHRLLAAPIEVPTQSGGTATEITVRLPDDAPEAWPVGLYTVQAIISQTGLPDLTTNELAFALAPRMQTITPNPAERDSQGQVTLTITCLPSVRPEQRASLLLGAREIIAQPHPAVTDSLSFEINAAPVGQHLVRLRIDGVDSLLVDRSSVPPVFDPSQQVTIT